MKRVWGLELYHFCCNEDVMDALQDAMFTNREHLRRRMKRFRRDEDDEVKIGNNEAQRCWVVPHAAGCKEPRDKPNRVMETCRHLFNPGERVPPVRQRR